MKKIVIILLSLLLYVSTGFSKEIVPQKVQVRAMVNAGVSTDDAEKLSLLMQKSRIGNKHIEAVCKIIAETAQNKLPVTPVTNKLYEGLAKKVPGTAIIRAMGKTLSRYKFGYETAEAVGDNKKQTKSIGDAIAEGLSAGLQKEDVNRILHQLKNRKKDQGSSHHASLVQEALLTARTMSRLGVTSARTGELVCLAIKEDYNARQMKWMHQRFIRETQNVSADKAANQYSDSLSHHRKKGASASSGKNNKKPENASHGKTNRSGGQGHRQ